MSVVFISYDFKTKEAAFLISFYPNIWFGQPVFCYAGKVCVYGNM